MYWRICSGIGTTADTQSPHCAFALRIKRDYNGGGTRQPWRWWKWQQPLWLRLGDKTTKKDFVIISLICEHQWIITWWIKLPRLAGGWRQRFAEMKNILYVWCVGERRNLGRGLNPLLPTGIWWSMLVFQSHWNCLFWTLKINCLFML